MKSALLSIPFCTLALIATSLTSCTENQDSQTTSTSPTTSTQSPISSVIRINSTSQNWSPSQPWNKQASSSRSALGAVLSDQRILTTAAMVTNATYIELENADSTHSIPAKVTAIDYEANLAILEADEATSDNATDFFKDLQAMEISKPLAIGDTLDIIQLEDSGMPLVTSSVIRTVDIISSFSAGHYFLTYQSKASMQSASNSYSLPAIHKGKLTGLLTSYDKSDQILDITAPEIISAFLKDAEDGQYEGFPSLGVAIHFTVDPGFREWLKIPDELGGLYVSKIAKGSAAENAGIEEGDVITKIGKYDIGRRGYYTDDNYGKLYWSHLIRGNQENNSALDLTILRDGKEHVINTTLTRPIEKLVPANTYEQAPRYLVKGGFIFQELTYSYLRAFGTDWESKAPLDLVDIIASQEDYQEGRNKIVLLTATIPTPATTGYESLRNYIITSVNGETIADIPSLINAFKTPDQDGLHTISIKDGTPETIYLDATTSDAVDQELLKRGIPALSHQ